jgi:hypothetical protein
MTSAGALYDQAECHISPVRLAVADWPSLARYLVSVAFRSQSQMIE